MWIGVVTFEEFKGLICIIITAVQYTHTVFLQRGSCIYSEKSYGMSHGSYYKIFMILRWPEFEFSKNCHQSILGPYFLWWFCLLFCKFTKYDTTNWNTFSYHRKC